MHVSCQWLGHAGSRPGRLVLSGTVRRMQRFSGTAEGAVYSYMHAVTLVSVRGELPLGCPQSICAPMMASEHCACV